MHPTVFIEHVSWKIKLDILRFAILCIVSSNWRLGFAMSRHNTLTYRSKNIYIQIFKNISTKELLFELRF